MKHLYRTCKMSSHGIEKSKYHIETRILNRHRSSCIDGARGGLPHDPEDADASPIHQIRQRLLELSCHIAFSLPCVLLTSARRVVPISCSCVLLQVAVRRVIVFPNPAP